MSWTQQVAAWWLDFFTLASILLAIALIAGGLIRQPVQRMVLAWSAIIGLLALAFCCVVPGWPRFALVSSNDTGTLSELPASGFVTAEELMGTLKPEKLLSTRPKPTNGVEVIAVEDGDTTKWARLRVPQRSVKFNYAGLVPSVLLTGSVITAAWLILGLLRASRLCRRAAPAPEFAQNELRTLVGSNARPPRLLIGETFSTAGAIGLWRPTILLPGDAVRSGETDASLRAQLAHEWAHIERGDLWLLAVGRALLVVLYAHPLYWLLRRRILADQELLADAAAAHYCGRHKYAETLVAWARHRPRGGTRLRWALGIWERPSQLSRRIAMLLNERIRLRMTCSRGWRISNACAMVCLVTGLSLLSISPARISKAEPDVAEAVAKPAPSAVVAEAKPEAVDIPGSCTDEKHKPVANALVRLYRVDHKDQYRTVPHGRIKATMPGDKVDPKYVGMLSASGIGGDPKSQRLLLETRTDAKGKYRFADVAIDKGLRSKTDELKIVAQAPGKATQIGFAEFIQDTGKFAAESLQLTMPVSGTLRGRIKNSEGKPVAGALVSCCEFNWLAKPVPGILCALTDADGRYEINDAQEIDVNDFPPTVHWFGTIRMVSFVMSVDHPDYAPGIIEYTKSPSTVDHVLERPAVVHGQIVFDESGQPAEKTRVQYMQDNGLMDAVITDVKGNYTLPRLHPGKYTIQAERDDRLVSKQEIVLAPGDRQLDMRLKNGGFIKGRVVDDFTDRAPIINRSMSIEVFAFTETRGVTNPCKGWVKDDGSFSITAEPGHNFIAFPNPEWQLTDDERWGKKGIDVALGQTVEVELRLSKRTGGWASYLLQVRTAEAKAKGEPLPPAPSVPPVAPEDDLSELADASETAMAKAFTNWSEESLPKEPMSLKAALMWMRSLQIAEEETIDGEDQVTTINFGAWIEQHEHDEPADFTELACLEYSVLAHINELPHAKMLVLIGVPGNDNWLEPLRGHKQLEELGICSPKHLTPAGIEHLATLPNFKILVINGPKIGDDFMAAASRLPKLQGLQIAGPISDEGVSHFKGNTKLTLLSITSIGNAKVTDESLREIGTMSNLEQLEIGKSIGDTILTDAGLKHLSGLTKLQHLTLKGTRITDAGLVYLQPLKSLKELNVSETSVTQKRIDELKKQLPELDVKMKAPQPQGDAAMRKEAAKRK